MTFTATFRGSPSRPRPRRGAPGRSRRRRWARTEFSNSSLDRCVRGTPRRCPCAASAGNVSILSCRRGEIERHVVADHVRARGEELAELDVGGAELETARAMRSRRSRLRALRPGQDHGQAMRRPGRRRRGPRPATRPERPRAGRPSRPGRVENRRRDCSCAIRASSRNGARRSRPNSCVHLTREKPARSIITAKSLWLGNLRIDSTR